MGHICHEHKPRAKNSWPCPECVLDAWTPVVRAACYVPLGVWRDACRTAGVSTKCLESAPQLAEIFDTPKRDSLGRYKK